MPTVLRIQGLRVVVFPNDHRPAHVHIDGGDRAAVFVLNCPDGPPELRENYGFRQQELTEPASWPNIWLNSAADGERYMVTREQYELATARGRVAEERFPRAVHASYDRKRRRIVVELANRVGFMFAPEDTQGLENAGPKDLEQVEISLAGRGLHFPTLDADLYIPALLEGVFGSKRWTAARLGQAGGRAKSAAKAKASRENGKLGGRPRNRAPARS